jgi:mono/diheme cytochrome c family protein
LTFLKETVMRDFLLGILVTVALLLTGALAYLRFGIAEVNADVAAPAWQKGLMQFAVHPSVKRQARGLQSPQLHTDEELIAGGKAYLDACAGCHRVNGSPRRKGVYFIPPTEFALDGSEYSEAERFWIIKHGIRHTGMSAYGPFYTDQKMWNLAEFVGRMRELPPAVKTALHVKQP